MCVGMFYMCIIHSRTHAHWFFLQGNYIIYLLLLLLLSKLNTIIYSTCHHRLPALCFCFVNNQFFFIVIVFCLAHSTFICVACVLLSWLVQRIDCSISIGCALHTHIHMNECVCTWLFVFTILIHLHCSPVEPTSPPTHTH